MKRRDEENQQVYNLASYECRLGRLKEARSWLERAFSVGDPKALKLTALEDNDLEPLWRHVGEI